jgi:ABC-type glutathione transport system ATPase component
MLKAEINNISVLRNGTELDLLKDIKFQLEAGMINVVLGKNGSGKSTLIRAVTGLLDKRFYKISGSVWYKDADLLTLPGDDLINLRRNKIRYVFQDAINSFDPLKKLGFYFRDYQSNPLLYSLLNEFLLPGHKELFSLYPYEISGGMAQRLLLIHALIARPQIVILDEPTSGIDTPIANLILLKMKEFISGGLNSVLLVTQDLQFARSSADRIAYLAYGKLSLFRSKSEFFGDNNIPDVENFLSAYNQLV